MISAIARKVEGRKKSGYGRLEEGMMWSRQSTGREADYGRWKDVRIYLERPYASSCTVELVGVLGARVSRDCVTSVRSYSDPPPTTWKGSE